MNQQISNAVLKKYLTRSTFIFLVVPYVIFFFGWLHGWMAILMTAVCMLPIVWDWKKAPSETTFSQADEKESITVWQIIAACGVALLLSLISGIGGFGLQNTDWEKHNMLLRDLIQQPWPLMYQFDAVQLPLVYYVAYYLPAALIGKAFGWIAANYVIFVESWVGISLTFLWGVVLIKRSWWKAVLLIAGFSGLDILGFLLVAPAAPMFFGFPITLYQLEWWSLAWLYPSFTSILFWAPNQGLIGWLAMSMLLSEMLEGERRYPLWYLGLTTFWSPFMTLGLIPFVLADWISQPHTLIAWMRRYALPNLCGVLLAGFIGLLYLSKFFPLPAQLSGEIPFGFFFSLTRDSSEVVFGSILMVLFWLFEGGIYGILVWKLLDKDDRRSRVILAVALLWLAILPFFYYGYYNDLMQKGSIVALFALTIVTGRAVLGQSERRRMRFSLAILLVIGLVTALINIGIQLEGMAKNRTLWQVPAPEEVFTLLELQEKERAEDLEFLGLEYNSLVSQYVGSDEAPFFQWFVRR